MTYLLKVILKLTALESDERHGNWNVNWICHPICFYLETVWFDGKCASYKLENMADISGATSGLWLSSTVNDIPVLLHGNFCAIPDTIVFHKEIVKPRYMKHFLLFTLSKCDY